MKSTEGNGAIQETLLLAAILANYGWEGIPESQSLVACACDDGAAVRAHSQVEDPQAVARQSYEFLHGWILPQMDLVLGESMCTGYFIDRSGEDEVANLGVRLDAFYLLSSQGAPKSN